MLAKAYLLAANRARSTANPLDGEDLLHTVLEKFLNPDGGRQMPEGVDVLVVLDQAMKSEASNRNKKAMNEKAYINANPSQEDENGHNRHQAYDDLRVVQEYFAKDDQVSELLKLMADGYKGKDLESRLGGRREYEAIRKRFRRGIVKLEGIRP